MDYTRRPQDEYPDKYQRCSVCNHYVRIEWTPEGGRYEPPSPTVSGASFTVYERCAIQLAGTSTALADGSDAPENSPVEVNLTLSAGSKVVFTVYGYFGTNDDLEGDTTNIIVKATENNIGPLTAPNQSLCGVFLTDDEFTGSAPADLDYTLAATRNKVTHTPAIAQPFFIGEGEYTSGSTTYYRQYTVPATATRLFLGNHISSGWSGLAVSVRGVAHQATSFNHVSEFQSGEDGFGAVIFTDRAASQGCPFCGSPAWRTGGKPGDLKRTW